MKNLYVWVIAFILSTGLVYPQNKNNYSPVSIPCELIYGKWESFDIKLPFGIQSSNKKDFWHFDENGMLFINAFEIDYTLNRDCSKLNIDNRFEYSILKLSKDSLSIGSKILPHESIIMHFKKIN